MQRVIDVSARTHMGLIGGLSRLKSVKMASSNNPLQQGARLGNLPFERLFCSRALIMAERGCPSQPSFPGNQFL